MFETVVIATDGSTSAERAVEAGADLAARFGATVHACYVVDESEADDAVADAHEDLSAALEATGEEAIDFVREAAAATGDGPEIVATVREGRPAEEVIACAREHGADLIATGTRGRHGEHAFLLGSVAEAIVRESPIPVLTVRQLEGQPDDDLGTQPARSS